MKTDTFGANAIFMIGFDETPDTASGAVWLAEHHRGMLRNHPGSHPRFCGGRPQPSTA